ncbi:dienelactone hydrolase family protein [Streptomyces pactum]|uniref:Dienelactone hydrolase family protein n=1 Tax=Streptomyces pactum TaxID=68249 RepID=A0ABS0NS53_9ACTN|nr:dienelactone hydrolase family protein [Streptomyces pactum]MBH5338036.1 dienelactone hydrolase family protein [Streptomyces pactum]
MAEVLLFHHAYGLTDGVRAFAGRLRAAGHTVHLADLYEGRVFGSLDEGAEYAAATGFDTLTARGAAAADRLPAGLVLAGISLGVVPAQRLARSRPGARGALLLEACLPGPAAGGPWPPGLPVQVHGMDRDPFFAGEGDLDAARALTGAAPHGELFLYPGDRHLFTDSGLPGYDEAAAELVCRRAVDFLDRLG